MSDAPPAGENWLPERYTLRRLLGAGGMGEVWLADDAARGHAVAVKRLKLRAEADGKTREEGRLRFKREYLILSRLDSPAIVKAFDAGESAGDLYYTMEFVAGSRLKEYFTGGRWREAGGAPTPNYFADPAGLERVWRAADELLAILAQLHAQSLIHRDLKPANLMVDERGALKLIDFGLARAGADAWRDDDAGTEITRAGAVLGSPSYLAPELIRAQPADARADLYACGVIFYELAAGRLPFTAASLGELLLAHLQQAARPPRELNGLISPAHGAWLMRLLAKAPAGRWATALDCRAALRDCAADGASALGLTLDLQTADLPAVPRDLLVAPFIGNPAAGQALEAACADLLAGGGGMLLLSGPTGSGKSKLGERLRSRAAEGGVRLWEGAGREAGRMPGQLFQGVFAAAAELFARRPETAARWLGPDGPVLADCFPVLRDLPAVRRAPPSPPLGPAAERSRLLAALFGFFNRAARDGRLALLLEDLHWADPLSLDLLSHLADNFTGAPGAPLPPLLLVGNHRDDPEALAGEFARWLERAAGPRVRRVALQPLTAPETRELIAALLGLDGPVPEPVVQRLFSLTGGNPYFICETLKTLVEGGQLQRRPGLPGGAESWNFTEWLAAGRSHGSSRGNLPSSIQSALERRLRELPAASLEALRAAALLGREFRFSWWLALTGLAEDPLLEIADTAIHQGLLQEADDDRLALVHDQLRATLLAGVTGLRARRMHQKILAILERETREPDALLDQLAEHALAAGAREPALRHVRREVLRLERMRQTGPALELLGRLDKLFPAGDPMPPDERLAVDGKRLTLHRLRTEIKPILAQAPALIETARARGATAIEQALWLDFITARFYTGDYPGALQAAEAAGEIARRTGDRLSESMALQQAATARMNLGELPAVEPLLERALALAEGSDMHCTAILNDQAMARTMRGDFTGAAQALGRAQQIARRLGDPHLLALTSGNLGEVEMMLGRLDAAEADLQAGHEHYREVGNHGGMLDTLTSLGRCATARGRLDRARGLLEQACAQAEAQGEIYFLLPARWALARNQLAEGQLEAAAAGIAALRARAEAGSQPQGIVRARVLAAALALAREDWPAAAAAAREALELAERHAFAAERAESAAALALAAAMQGGPLDDTALRRAIAEAAGSGNLELELLIRCLAARAARAAGRPGPAAEFLAGAAQRAAAAGLRPLAEQAARLEAEGSHSG